MCLYWTCKLLRSARNNEEIILLFLPEHSWRRSAYQKVEGICSVVSLSKKWRECVYAVSLSSNSVGLVC